MAPTSAERSCLTFYVGPRRGGCYQRLQRLMRALAARGWAVHFVGREPPAVAGIHFHALAAAADGGGSPSLGLLLAAARRAAAVARRERVSLAWTFGAVYTAALEPFRRGRTVTFLRGSLRAQERARGSGPHRLLLAAAAERLAVSVSHRVVAVSPDLAAAAGAKAVVLPNEVGPAREGGDRAAARSALGLPPEAFVAAYAGAIAPIKSLETLLAAAQQVPALQVALLGFSDSPSPYETSLRARAAALGGRVHLLPWRPDAEALMAAADVIVLPSLDEGCPNLLLEAMAHGRPALGARCPGIAGLLAHDSLLFPPGDARGLAERLAGLMAQPAALAAAAAMVRQRASLFRFDWDARAVALLEEALAP